MKNWLRLASRIAAILSGGCSQSAALAAITSSVSTGTILAALAKCIVFAKVVAMRRPVKLPGPIEI